MSVDDDLPWDEDAESSSWYDVGDDARWDPDDDGLPQITEDPTRDDGAEIVLFRFRAPGGLVESSRVAAGGAGTGGADPPPDGDREASTGDADGDETAAAAPDRTLPRRTSGVLGLAAGAVSDLSRFLAGALGVASGQEHREVARVLDTAVGVGNGMITVAGVAVGTAGRLAKPVLDLALHPPLIPPRWQPGGVLEQVETAGRRSRLLGEDDALALTAAIIPAILDAVLDRIDLTQLVLDRVDLNRVIREVDLDAAIEGVDLGKVIERIDIDAILAKVDIDGVIATIDLNKVIDRVDIGAVLAKVDIDGIIATIDLDGVISRVDVNAVASTIDIDAIIDRVDLSGIAEDVITEIDLPRIIRESSGSIASETMVGVRMTSASADAQIGRIMERLRLRRRDPEADLTLLDVPLTPLPPRRRLLRGRSAGDATDGRIVDAAPVPPPAAPPVPPAAPPAPTGGTADPDGRPS